MFIKNISDCLRSLYLFALSKDDESYDDDVSDIDCANDCCVLMQSELREM